MFSYDLVSDTWTQEPSLPGNRSGSFSTYVTSRDWIIVLGGKDVTGPISNDEALIKWWYFDIKSIAYIRKNESFIGRYDIRSKTWSTLNTSPLAPNLIGPKIFYNGGDLVYVLGGSWRHDSVMIVEFNCNNRRISVVFWGVITIRYTLVLLMINLANFDFSDCQEWNRNIGFGQEHLDNKEFGG